MTTALKSFFKRKETFIGIAAALAFQLIFFTVWLTAYDGLLDRTDQLKVTVVNKDSGFGNTITNMVTGNPDITAKKHSDLNEAKQEMDNHESNMVLYIPAHFTEYMQAGKPVKLDYYINQATPALSKQVVEKMAVQLTKAINDKAAFQIEQELGGKISKSVASKAGNNPEVEKIAESTVKAYQNALPKEPVQMTITKTNNVDGFSASMIPLLVVLASFVGAMIMSMQLHSVSIYLRTRFNKWSLFLSRLFINLVVSLTLSLMTLILIKIFNIELQQGMITAWWFQSLLFFSFLSTTQMFVVVFGNVGMVLNIITMATQLVSSGAMVPRELLSDFYLKIGSLLPATYGADGYFSLVFGGGNLVKDAFSLLLITGILLIVTAVSILFKKQPIEETREVSLSA